MSTKIEKLQKRAAAIIPRMNAAYEKACELDHEAEFQGNYNKRYALEDRAKKWYARERKYWRELEEITRQLTEDEYWRIEGIGVLEVDYLEMKGEA